MQPWLSEMELTGSGKNQMRAGTACFRRNILSEMMYGVTGKYGWEIT